MSSKERNDLFIKGLDKFTFDERMRVLKGYYRVRKKVIHHLANNDSIKPGTLNDYRDYKINYDSQHSNNN